MPDTTYDTLNLPDHTLPVVPCGYAKIKDRYRFQFLVRTPSICAVNKRLSTLTFPRTPRCTVDIDPLSTYF